MINWSRIVSVCFLLSQIISVSCSAQLHKSWTLFVYMIVDDTSDAQAERLLSNMMQRGSTDMVNMLACVAMRCNDGKKKIRYLSIAQNAVLQCGDAIFDTDDDAEICKRALLWSANHFPSDHLMISVWNRSGHHFSDTQFKNLFSWTCDSLRGGQKIDIVLADDSYMATIDMAYALSGSVVYYIASQLPIVPQGFDYSSIIDRITAQETTAFETSQLLLDVYRNSIATNVAYSLSTMYLSQLPVLCAAINEYAAYLTQLLTQNRKYWVRQSISKSVQRAIGFQSGYVDLFSLYGNLAKNANDMGLTAAAKQSVQLGASSGQEFVKSLVVGRVASQGYQQAGGISISCPNQPVTDPVFEDSYYAQSNPAWRSLLDTISRM